MSHTYENDVPRHFNISYDENKIPQRELHDFTVTRNNDTVSICVLDDKQKRDAPVLVRGTIISKSNKSISVESAPLIEWCIEYSTSTDPTLWIRTKYVWYKLNRPSKEYAKVHELARRRYELCSRIYILLSTLHTDQCTFRDIAPLLSQNYHEMKSYTEEEILLEKDFVLSQFQMLKDPLINDSSFVKDLKALSKKSPSSSPGNHNPQQHTTENSTSSKRNSSAKHANTSNSKKDNYHSSRNKDKDNNNSSNSFLDNNSNNNYSPSSPVNDTNNSNSDQWQPNTTGLDSDATSRLIKKAEKALSTIMKNRLAYPFLQPVDPVQDGCPDYLNRIKRPMDYGTIKKRLDSKTYYHDISSIVEDVRLVTRNCIHYNSEEHDFSKWAGQLQQKFESGLRSAEETELSNNNSNNNNNNNNNLTGNKRTSLSNNNNNNKKKRRTSSDPSGGSGGSIGSSRNSKVTTGNSSGGGKKSSKPGRKTSKNNNNDKSPNNSASLKQQNQLDDDENLTTNENLCVRSTSQACDKFVAQNSKYCSPECGLIVAKERIAELNKKGLNPDEYIRSYITKTLVHSRS